MTVVKNCVCVLIFIGIVYCIKVVPERAKVIFADTNYIQEAKLYVSRHGRKSDYYLNLETNIVYPLNNNVTMHLIFYEYLHNEYRRSFVEFHFKLCEFLDEAYVGSAFRIGCPLIGNYHLLNLTFPTENFPYVFPFEKFRVDGYGNTTDKNIMLFNIQVYAHIQRK